MGTEERARGEDERPNPDQPRHRVGPSPRPPPPLTLLPPRREEGEQARGEVLHGQRWPGAVRCDPCLREEFLPLWLGEEGGYPLPGTGGDLPPPVLAPQEHDEESVCGESPCGEDRPRIQFNVPERIVPTREVDERHPAFLEGTDEALQLLAIRPLEGLAVVVDRADLFGQRLGCC